LIPILVLAGGCAARATGPGAAGPPPPGGAAPSSNTYTIAGYQVNKTVFGLGMAGASLLGGVIIDNVPESSSNGELDVMDFVPVGLYALGGGFLIGAF
jgi:hypothetical protein